MFCELQDALSPISSFSNNYNFTAKEQKFVKTMNYKKFEYILNLINDQSEIKNQTYSLFKQQYTTLKFEYVSEVVNTKNDEYHTVIDSTDDYLVINALSPEFLSNFILDNHNKKYIFLTLNYTSNLMKSGHQAILMIDNQNKLIYMIDPNGKSDYLDNVFMEQTNFYVETLLSKYFSELNKFGLEYKYIYSASWNEKQISINKKFDNNFIGNGHCVITTLMLIHLIITFDVKPDIVFELLNNLSNDELLFLIKEYSLGVYNILCNKS